MEQVITVRVQDLLNAGCKLELQPIGAFKWLLVTLPDGRQVSSNGQESLRFERKASADWIEQWLHGAKVPFTVTVPAKMMKHPELACRHGVLDLREGGLVCCACGVRVGEPL